VSSAKKRFLIAYNYGMGAAWGVIAARSEEEIIRRYPELEVCRTQPEWMTGDLYDRIVDVNSYDIDYEPHGWLAQLAHKNREK
jgi:hypothetical protein